MPKRKRDEYIRASSVSNYILYDKLSDYLKIKYIDKNSSSEYIMNQGNIYEQELIKVIKQKHKIVTLSNINDTKEKNIMKQKN